MHDLGGLEEMDCTDKRLLALMTSNPRIHLQELARELGISKQAAHHRIRALTDIGIIRGTGAGISFAYLNAIPVAIFGRSNATSSEKVMGLLGESEFTRRVVVAGGNYLYVVGNLRSVAEIDGYAQLVRRTAEMPNPSVGIYCLDDVPMPDYQVDGIVVRRQKYKKLSPLDFRIIASLRHDARRPIAEIAEAVGASSKTVKRHLDSMLSDRSLELQLFQDTPLGGDMLSIIHINLKIGSDKGEVARRLISKYPSMDGYVRSFINLPSFLVIVFWCGDLREVRGILREICRDDDVTSAMLNIGYLERIYDATWRDRVLDAYMTRCKRPED